MSTRKERIILRKVNEKGKISMNTVQLLINQLEKINRDCHIEIVIHPKENVTVLIKTIDNEIDAKQTISNIQDKLNKN